MADLPIFGIKSRRDEFLMSLFSTDWSVAKQKKVRLTVSETLPRFKDFESKLEEKFVELDQHALEAVKDEMQHYYEYKHQLEPPSSLPLNFPSVDEEIGFHFIQEAWKFGSRYDPLLEQKSTGKRGSMETMQFGLLGMFISSKPPYTADTLLELTETHVVGTSFGFPIHEQQSLDFAKMGGVYQDVAGPLFPFAKQIAASANEMALLLRGRQMNHLGDLARLLFNKCEGDVWKFIHNLTQALPLTFNDEAQGLTFHCKAQKLCVDLHERFPEVFPFKNIHELLPLVDGELCFALRKLGVIHYSSDLGKKIDSEEPAVLKFGGKEELAIRSATMLATGFMMGENIPTSFAHEWLVNKGRNIVHPTFRHHLCETAFY